MNFAEFKKKVDSRTDVQGYFKEGYLLHIDDKEVYYVTIASDKIDICYRGNHLSEEIYGYDDLDDYNIEFYILEKDIV
jgi:hypothetical protein